MASSKMIKRYISDAKKKAARLDKELKSAKDRIKKLEGDMKKAVAAEKTKAAPKKKVAGKKAAPKKKVAGKKAAPRRKGKAKK